MDVYAERRQNRLAHRPSAAWSGAVRSATSAKGSRRRRARRRRAGGAAAGVGRGHVAISEAPLIAGRAGDSRPGNRRHVRRPNVSPGDRSQNPGWRTAARPVSGETGSAASSPTLEGWVRRRSATCILTVTGAYFRGGATTEAHRQNAAGWVAHRLLPGQRVGSEDPAPASTTKSTA